MAGFWDITNAVSRTLEDAQSGVEEMLFEPVIRLGVTGLSRAGKTVFITSLVANLLDRGRMPQLRAAAEGRILTAFLQPQPNDAVARFAFEDHLAALTGPEPYWPEGTRSISQLRLSLRVRPSGMLSGLRGPRTIHLDIVDYPGEWLLDLPLLEQSYGNWAAETIALARTDSRIEHARPWLDVLDTADGAAVLDEREAQRQAEAFRGYLRTAREAGLSAVAPGRFLMPGDLEGSPALTFAPLPEPVKSRGNSLHATFARRFDAYKRIVVKPFYRDHFAKIDRQIVLVDALGAINAGPQAVEDLRQAMAAILMSFRPGRNSWLSSVLGRRVEKILFAATKADHLHHSQHAALAAITEELLDDARRRADFRGAKTEAMSIAALRATIEETVRHDGAALDCVRGRLLDGGREVAMYAGDLPKDPGALLVPARQGAAKWLDAEYGIMKFAPPRVALAPDEGPPHIRLDRATEFLIGDRLA
ncbi:YcjX family protein [Algicella marina]|uniref:YcjX family protein n=1 Tax=Algicella marina TaxID=2683284 RepID=A0A6P1T351_9RHOB|nr:YcjX family protein [Algicella marina]QHQ36093.1 YcjX family protein [Algicella marina]